MIILHNQQVRESCGRTPSLVAGAVDRVERSKPCGNILASAECQRFADRFQRSSSANRRPKWWALRVVYSSRIGGTPRCGKLNKTGSSFSVPPRAKPLMMRLSCSPSRGTITSPHESSPMLKMPVTSGAWTLATNLTICECHEIVGVQTQGEEPSADTAPLRKNKEFCRA
jgi:hypothetical protein